MQFVTSQVALSMMQNDPVLKFKFSSFAFLLFLATKCVPEGKEKSACSMHCQYSQYV